VQARGEKLRSRGLFVGVQLVRNRVSKTPFDAGLKLHAAIRREAFALGLMVYPMGGTVDGKIGDHLLLAPPFICAERDIDEIVSRLTDAIDGALSAV
jgi:adenosylmethionine-8-amino-7-oxononanoate aminotransferase